MKLKQVMSRMPQEDYERLLELAKKENRSVSSMVIQLIKRYKED